MYIPKHTSRSATAFFKCNIFSPRNIEDKIEPETGIKKLKMAMDPTLLYFKSVVHIENATAESIDRYNKIIVEFNVKLVIYPLFEVPITSRKIPPIVS